MDSTRCGVGARGRRTCHRTARHRDEGVAVVIRRVDATAMVLQTNKHDENGGTNFNGKRYEESHLSHFVYATCLALLGMGEAHCFLPALTLVRISRRVFQASAFHR